MIGRIYKWVWTRVGGMPWTYIIRGRSRLGALVGSGLLFIGVASLRLPKPLILITGTLIGFILGHLYW